ncbi:MAG: hypothetical protein OEQ29_19430 [Alphaproteobacteria bacterium]|nr:hypothetical protein [Alphaproteobacteria bacterium]
MKKGRIAGLAVIAVIAGGGYFVAQLYADRVADRRVGKILTKLPEGTAVKYRSAGYSIWNGEIRLRDVKVDSRIAGEARIKGVTVADFDKFHRVPHYVKVKVRGFEMKREKANAATRRWMDKLRYKSITVDVEYAYRYRPDLRELVIERARITGPQVGTLVISGRLSNVRSLDVKNLGDLIAIGMQSVVRGVSIAYTDDSLTDRLIEAYAAERGGDAKTYRAALVRDLDAEMRRTKSANLRRQIQHVRAFIERPGKIVVTIKPRSTVPVFLIAAMPAPHMIQRTLGINITTLPGVRDKTKKKN